MVNDGMVGVKHDPRQIDTPNETGRPFGRPVLHFRCWPLAELDPGRLDLGELVEGVQRLVAADARLLVAAERRGDVAAVVGVDPYRAGTQALGELEGLVDVRGEDRRSQGID